MSAEALYEKALRSYLLTKYTPAANTCLKAIAALPKFPAKNENNVRLNIWTLYLNIASTLLVNTPFLGVNIKLLGIETVNSLDKVCRLIWKKLTQEGFGGVGSIDARLVSACLVMDLKLNQLAVAREISEDWFASLSDSVLDQISANQDDQVVVLGYNEIVDMYITRILPGMDDFESANTFLQYNSVLSHTKKEKLQISIQEQQESIQNERKKKRKLEEAARQAAEEKKKELELKKKLEEEAKGLEQAEQEQKEALARKVKQEVQELVEKKYKQPEQPSHTQNTMPTSRTVVNNNHLGDSKAQVKALIQKWMSNITAQGVATSGAALIFIFALFAILRGHRGRLTIALQGLMNKLWQTIKMGTKVTYM